MSKTKETKLYKWLDNYWYHNKWKTIIIAFFIITFTVCLVQCSNLENPDQNIFLYLNRNVTANQTKALSESLSPFFDDYNNDGEVIISIDNVSYNSNTKQTDIALSNNTKVLGEIGRCSCILYIVDKNKFDYYMQENLMLFENLNLPDLDGYAWNWKGSELQKELEKYDLPEDLYFCIRRVGDTTAENEKTAMLAENAKKVLNNLISGKTDAK